MSACCVSMIGIAVDAGADCDPMNGVHYPTNQQPNYTGAAQTSDFRCAINGLSDLTAEQMREQTELLPPKLYNRFYVLLGGNVASEGIYKVKNISDEGSGFVNAEAVTTTAKVASNNFEVGFGYVWKEFAFDVQYLPYKSISYSTVFNGNTGAPAISATVKGYAVLGNLYWFCSDLYNLKFYGVLDFGLSRNDSTTTSNGAILETGHYSPAYGLGFGGRFNVISKCYADILVRYMLFGDAKLLTNTGLVLKEQQSWLGISLRLLWLW